MRTRASSLAIGVLSGVVASGAAIQPDGLREALTRATAYVSEYEKQFSLLVAEEHSVQEEVRAESGTGGNLSQRNPSGGFVNRGSDRRREIKSDYLIVRLPGGGGMLPFRDTFEVDGRAVRDRQDRLTGLFLQPSASSFEQAARVVSESTRYNLGGVVRSINMPTLALLFLGEDVVSRFAFERAGDEVVAGRPTVIVVFNETARPTLIKTSAGRDLAVNGSIWIDPTGVVVRTSMVAADVAVRATVTVTFRADPDLGFWVPDQMTESYVQRGEPEIRGTSTYRNYRRFRVSTDEQIKRPPG